MTEGEELGRKSVSLLLATWLIAWINLLAGILIARVLGPAAVGSLAFGFGLSGLVLAALLPGFTQAHLKRIGEGRDVGVCLGTFGTIKLGLYALLALAFLVARPWRELLFETRTLHSVFVLLLAGRVLSNFAEVFTVALLARELAVQQSLVLVASRGLRALATVAAVVWLRDLVWVAGAYALEGLVELVVGALFVHAWLGIRPRAPTRASLADYWGYARPLLFTVPIAMVQDSIDRVVVKQWAGLTAAGYYHVARGFWEILGSVSQYPTTFLLTRMSALFADRSPERDREARSLFFGALDRLLFATVPLGLALWIFARPAVVLIFGPEFAPADVAVRIFVVATLAANLFNPYTQILYALDAHARLVPVGVLRLVLYLLALGMLVPGEPLLGGFPAAGLAERGAALCRLFLLLFPAWLYIGWARRLAGIGAAARSWTYVGGFVMVLLLAEAAERLWPALPPFAVSALAAGVGFAAYAGWLWILHPGSRANVAYYVELLHPGRLLAFFRRDLGALGPARGLFSQKFP